MNVGTCTCRCPRSTSGLGAAGATWLRHCHRHAGHLVTFVCAVTALLGTSLGVLILEAIILRRTGDADVGTELTDLSDIRTSSCHPLLCVDADVRAIPEQLNTVRAAGHIRFLKTDGSTVLALGRAFLACGDT